jgi:hypothetical protein
MFWSLNSLTFFWRTIARILFLFIWLLFKLSSSCTVPIADFENKRSEISCKLFCLPICYLWWLFQKLVVSTKFYLNCNINLPQSLHSIIAYYVYVETLYIFLDGEHHMFKWEQVVYTKGVIRSSKSKGIQHKGQAKNHKMTNNDP